MILVIDTNDLKKRSHAGATHVLKYLEKYAKAYPEVELKPGSQYAEKIITDGWELTVTCDRLEKETA